MTGNQVPPGKFVALLVEDNRADVLLVQEAIALYELPLVLHVLDDGEKAFEFIERVDAGLGTCPRVLLLDLNLPKRTGQEVLQRIRQSPMCKDIPVLIITSSNSLKDRNEVAALGASGYFSKPPDYQEFLKVGGAVKRLIEQHT